MALRFVGAIPGAVAVVAASCAFACGGSAFGTDSQDSEVGDAAADSGSPGGGHGSGTGGGSQGGTGNAAGGAAGASTGGRTGTGGRAATGGGSSGGQPSGGAGGQGTTVQLASSYEQSCSYDGECVLVTEGDACGCPGCENAAINHNAQIEWNADRSAIDCTGHPAPPCVAIACAEVLAGCAHGTCTARKPIIIDAAGYDTACQADSDCRVIPLGEVCSVCKCAAAAVNLAGYSKYQALVASAACTPGGNVCDCATIDTAHCELNPNLPGSGTCALGSIYPVPF